MEIRAADAAGTHPNQDLPRARFGRRYVHVLQGFSSTAMAFFKPLPSFDDEPRRVFHGDHLVPHGGPAEDAAVVVLLTACQDEKEFLPDRSGSPALGAI